MMHKMPVSLYFIFSACIQGDPKFDQKVQRSDSTYQENEKLPQYMGSKPSF